MSNSRFSIFILVVFLLQCTSTKTKTTVQDAEATEQDAEDAGKKEDARENTGEMDSETENPNAVLCPNGVVDPTEQCDDGDFDDSNGCTSLCQYSCEDNSNCDDLNPCNGVETCGENHACDSSDPSLANGTECGEAKSCWEGSCRDNVCGDGIKASDEVCDDGDIDPNNGCTPDCDYSCKKDKDCEDSDPCSGAFDCDTDKHLCVGDELADETVCVRVDNGEEGWCQKGVCVPTNCGNGEKEGGEECDDGEDNGTEDTECLINCTLNRCGDGSIDPGEECDDGNQTRLDGCDSDCKWEFVSRVMELNLLKGEAPDFCVHSKNQFANAFASEALIGGVFRFNPLETINADTKRRLEEGISHVLIQILDSSDNSMRTSDEEVTLGIYDAIAAEGWPYEILLDEWREETDKIFQEFIDSLNSADGGIPLTDSGAPDMMDPDMMMPFPTMPPYPTAPDPPMPTDFPFEIMASGVDKDGRPAKYNSVPAKQNGGGRILSSEPGTIKLVQGFLGFDMYDYVTRIEFDMDKLSRPETELEAADDLKLPETWGSRQTDSDSEDEDFRGILCGAMKPNSEKAPLTKFFNSDTRSSIASTLPDPSSFCCKSDGSGKYRACLPDDFFLPEEMPEEMRESFLEMLGADESIALDGDCDSEIDILLNGCWVCMDWTSDSSNPSEAPVPPPSPMNGSDCSLYKPDAAVQPYCVEVIHAIDYDVDTDGDGKNDAFSGVFSVAGRRASVVGIAE